MKWEGRQGSRNIEDRRGKNVRRVGGSLGIGAIIIAILAMFLGDDSALNSVIADATQGGGQATTTNAEYQPTAQEQELAQMVSVVLKETEDVWYEIFDQQLGRRYVPPKLVLFTEATTSACGGARSATGPFYCPADQKVYIDLSFYDELRRKFRAPGDFAMAYVVAHEVAHHVQNLLGYTRQVDAQRGRVSQEKQNDLSVRLELMADFLAGVWAHHAHRKTGFLERGDIEEALNAAAAIGDDRIQMESRGYTRPETFTHGTSEQRMRWLRRGIETGDIRQGDTFQTWDL